MYVYGHPNTPTARTLRRTSTDAHSFPRNLPQGAEIFIKTKLGQMVATVTVHPWADGVRSLETQVFDPAVPSQRQYLLFAGARLQEDGRVLAQHGVVAESTVYLVSELVSDGH